MNGLCRKFLNNFRKMSSPGSHQGLTTSKLNFFHFYWYWFIVEFRVFFLTAFVVSYLQIQQVTNTLNYRNFPRPYRCSIQSLKAIGLWPRPASFEIETRPANFPDWDSQKWVSWPKPSLETPSLLTSSVHLLCEEFQQVTW